MRNVLILLAALVGAPAVAQQAPVARPAVPEMTVYTFHTTPETGSAGRRLIRKPALDYGRRTIARELYPQSLLAEPGRRQENARVMVELNATGQPTACTPDGGEVYVDQRRIEEPVAPALQDLLCAQAMGNFGYRHALGADGQPVAATVAVEGRFGWQNYFLISPAPPPPAGDVVSVDGWPVRYLPRVPAGAYLPLPPGDDFVERDRNRPRTASVELLFSTDAAGALTQCRVMRPSGIAVYDEASCRVLAATKLPHPITQMPLQLNWDRRRVSARLPVRPQGPELPAFPPVDTGRIAGVDLPRNGAVTVILTVSPEGGLSGCTVSGPSYVDALDAAACALFPPDLRFNPARGNFGEPVAGTLRMVVDWKAATVRRDGY